MSSEEIPDPYRWEPGTCFRCARTGIDTALIETLHPRSSPVQEVRACRDCLIALETKRRPAAEAEECPSEPGGVHPDDGAEECRSDDR